MAAARDEQRRDPQSSELSFDERFSLIIDAEYIARDNRRLQRLLKDAGLRISDACIEDIKTGPARGAPTSDHAAHGVQRLGPRVQAGSASRG